MTSLARTAKWAVLLFALAAGTAVAADLGEALRTAPELIAHKQFDAVVSALTAPELAAEVAQSATAQYWLGRAYAGLKQHKQAQAAFAKAVQLKPDSAESWMRLGLVREQLGLADQALTALRRAGKLKPGLPGLAEAIRRATATEPPPAALPSGRRVAFRDAGLQVGVSAVTLRPSRVRDYTFAKAPTDWVPAGGLWAMTNRWSCSPQFTWLGGWGEQAVCTWNKRRFEGDLVVEIYAGMKMGLGNVSSYKNPCDMNLTICGDGQNPDSGYTFMYGGELNTVTRIMKGTQVLAETTDPKFLLPQFEDTAFGTYDFHRKWWGLRAVKRGGHLEFYLDNQLALTADDPEPLPGGQVAIWTCANGIIVARATIFYEREVGTREHEAHLKAAALRALPRPPESVQFASETHPGIFNDFEHSLGLWREVDRQPEALAALLQRDPQAVNQPELGLTDPQGAAIGIVPRQSGGHCLQVTNENAGGDFAVALNLPAFSVRDYPWLSFDYKVPPDVKINLFLQANDRLYEVRFTGRSAAGPPAEMLGSFEGLQPDGQWHHARLNLRGLLTRRLGHDADIKVANLFFGNLGNEGYLLCGFGGNHAGATYYLDNFWLGKPGPPNLKLAWQPVDSAAKPTGYRVLLDGEVRSGKQHEAQPEAGLEVAKLEAGPHLVEVIPQLEQGRWGTPATMRLVVDATGPTVAALSPVNGKPTGDPTIRAELSDGPGVGVDPASIKLNVNGKEFTLASPGMAFDPVSEVLTFHPEQARLLFKDGQRIAVVVEGTDFLGHALVSPARWASTMSYKLDRQAPPAPSLTVPTPPLCREGFEDSLGGCQASSGGYAVLSADPTTAAAGARSLRVYQKANGGDFGLVLRSEPYEAGSYPVVSFDYKIPARINVDFVVGTSYGTYSIKFLDNDCAYSRIGDLSAQVRADDRWHHLQFNLFELLHRALPTAANYRVTSLQLLDSGWTANCQGVSYHLDNFALLPAVSGAEPLSVKWAATDATGIAGVSLRVDRNPHGTPPRKVTSQQQTCSVALEHDGLQYLHARCVDGAGNWGPPSHVPLLVDRTPPQALARAPAPGPGAQSLIELALLDAGGSGVDPRSIRLSVGGTEYALGNPALTYNAATKQLQWNCESATPPVVFKDQQPVEVKLTAAADYAGNPVPQPPAWTWTMDYKLDSTPPAIKAISCAGHVTFLADTFEDGLNAWATRSGKQGAKVERDTTTAASGQASVKLTNQTAGGYMQARVCASTFDATTYPIVSFDYKVPAGVKIDLMFNLAGNWRSIAFTDDPAGAILKLPGIKADGQWHHVSFNLARALRQVQAKGALPVSEVILSDRNKLENPAGASLNIDNFFIGSVGTANPALSWTCTDTTGIQGYSYVFDQQPATDPGRKVLSTSNSFRPKQVPNGFSFFHLRALDGAGNWGPIRHFALAHGKIPPTK